MNILDKTRLLQTSILSSLIMGFGGVAYAQIDTTPTEVEQIEDDEDEFADGANEIVVTGSRIKRNAFTSTSPLQVLDVETARDLGAVTIDDIFSLGSTTNNGQQVNTDVSNVFVTDNGPGTSTISLRSLGANRTLVLINGRRFAPSGVGGTPVNADTNLIPTIALSGVDTLLDGASTVYGSDAIAGVVNVQLNDDFEGARFRVNLTDTDNGGGFSQQYGAIVGSQGDKGGFTISAEYFNRDRILTGQRDFFQNTGNGRTCVRDVETTVDGGIFSDDCAGNIGALGVLPLGGPATDLNGVDIVNFGGGGSFPSVLFDPGAVDQQLTDIFGQEIPNFRFANQTDSTDFAGIRDGANRFDQTEIQGELERFSLFTTVNYDLNPFIEFYSEASFSNVRTSNLNPTQQIFPTVPGDNPFNPFGIDATVIQFIDGIGDTETEREQTRIVGGFRGDFSAFGNSDDWFNDWTYDIFAAHTRSLAVQRDEVVLEERLALSLNTTEIVNGEAVCGQDLQGFTDFFGFLDDVACVPVDFFSGDLFQNQNLSDAERDFLLGQITTDSSVAQINVVGAVTGDLPISLPGGEVGAAFGFELRKDSVDTDGDTVFNLGLAAGRNQDQDSSGSANQSEVFGELLLPIFRDSKFGNSLEVELGGRLIDNEFFGGAEVYSIKGNYQPTDWLTLRGTFGTSFRAPNLQFLFIGGQSGFAGGATDPCDTPPADPDGNDPRDPTIIANCQLLGIDPFNFNSPGIQTFTTGAEASGGTVALDPEESDSLTLGFALDNPWDDVVEARLAATYWEIEIENGITFPGAGVVTNNCFTTPNLASPFCDLITRNPDTNFISSIETTPLNLDSEEVAGVDVTLFLGKEFDVDEKTLGLTFNGSVTRVIDNEIFNDDGFGNINVNFENGEFGDPKWRATGTLRASYEDFNLAWTTTFASSTIASADPAFVPPAPAADGSFDIFEAGSRTLHNASISYGDPDIGFRVNLGVRNIFDKEPSLIDNSFDFFANTIVGSPGQDLQGRRFTVGITQDF